MNTRQKEQTREEKGIQTEEATGEAVPHRRRRADRYAAEETIPAESVREFSLTGSSETAREVANRYRQRKERDIPGATTRVPAQTARPGSNIRGGKSAREKVGYASGHMGMDAGQRARMSEAGRARLAAENRGAGTENETAFYNGGRNGEREFRTSAGSGNRGERNRNPGYSVRPAAARREEPPRRSRKFLTTMVIILLVIGLLAMALLLIPGDMGGPLGTLKQSLSRLLKHEAGEGKAQQVSIELLAQDREESPAELDFAVITGKNATDVRLVKEDGEVLLSDQMMNQREEDIRWELSWYAEEAYTGRIGVQIRIAESWTETECGVEVQVLPPEKEDPRPSELPEVVVAEETPQVTVAEETAAPAEAGPNDGENGDQDRTDAEKRDAAEPELSEETEAEAGETAENDSDIPEEEPAEEAGFWGENMPEEDPDAVEEEDPEKQTGTESETGETEPETESRKTEESAPETAAENEARPLMTVSAAESANPSLITAAVIYNGNKKVAEYARADAEKIHMPTLGEYSKQKMGILTFRTDAFRQNASIGTVKGLDELQLAWTAEAGSIKGSGQTYYGIGWVGQPAIVKWSKEVREQSDLYDSKKEKTGLKEVIVAGMDGRIYFLDLADGTATRNSIKLGYPMRGTPSVHPGGAPYMTVGQFARKMASGQGTIGLRQYNLYTMKELSLIDGLDAKKNRPYNLVGSFETSALIDRTVKSPVMITAGTNGMLYLINLNGEFDYNAGTYTQSPTMVVMKSKAKGEKDASTAVEASIAMYDHYVYYADMGGILRCVDTNTLTTAWAVSLGDSVESTPALDWHGEDGLDLYTATLLSARKKGNAEVKCFDALTGEERWTASFGVRKDTKNKTVSGFRASPVIGQNRLAEYVYYTVNNLSEEGQEALGLGSETAALIALYKEDGRVAWAAGLSGRGYSSPVAVYDAEGNGAVIQCAGDGSVLMLDGETGEKKALLQIDGAIEASPAVYDGIMVIGTTEKNKNNIYGIYIH